MSVLGNKLAVMPNLVDPGTEGILPGSGQRFGREYLVSFYTAVLIYHVAVRSWAGRASFEWTAQPTPGWAARSLYRRSRLKPRTSTRRPEALSS